MGITRKPVRVRPLGIPTPGTFDHDVVEDAWVRGTLTWYGISDSRGANVILCAAGRFKEAVPIGGPFDG